VIAPGCPCCQGNLTMRVTLARVLRLEHPDHLVLALIDGEHRESVRRWLEAPPFGTLIAVHDI
jgi:hypothetical protein